MKDYEATRMQESVERFRASMAGYQGSLDTGARIVEKGRTLLVVRGERSELRARAR